MYYICAVWVRSERGSLCASEIAYNKWKLVAIPRDSYTLNYYYIFCWSWLFPWLRPRHHFMKRTVRTLYINSIRNLPCTIKVAFFLSSVCVYSVITIPVCVRIYPLIVRTRIERSVAAVMRL